VPAADTLQRIDLKELNLPRDSNVFIHGLEVIVVGGYAVFSFITTRSSCKVWSCDPQFSLPSEHSSSHARLRSLEL